MDLKGKVFFITGAAQGLGRGMAEAVLNLGAKVYLTDINSVLLGRTAADLQKEFGEDRVKSGKCDVCDENEFSATFQSAVTSFGNVDVIANNAGIMTDKIWEKEIGINFRGVVLGTNLAIKHMRKDKGGRGGVIINTASLAGVTPCFWFPVYAGTKAAVIAFTKSWAANPTMSNLGIRLNCLCPSAVDTNLLDMHSDDGIAIDTFNSLVEKMGRLSVADVGKAFVKLAVDEDNNGKLLAVTVGKEPFYFSQITDPHIGPPKEEAPKTE